ncbi:MAG: ABC transporter permease [Phycisphaerales bacterium]
MRMLPFQYAVRNLTRSPSRLMLSLAGSTLVVLLVIAAAGFVRGMESSIRESGDTRNVIILGAGSEESVERSEIPASVPGVLAATVPGVVRRAGVDAISPEVSVMMALSVEEHGPLHQAIVRGVTPAAMVVHSGVALVSGRLPLASADEVIVGRMAAEVLRVESASLAPGAQLWIDKRPWTVVGTFAAPGMVFDAEIWTPITDLQNAMKRETISCVVATLDPAEAELADVDAFTKLRPDLELSVLGEREYYGNLAAFFRPLKVVTWLTAGLIAVGGLFGGLNTMYAAFASRVRELGTLQSMGFSRLAIVLSLVQEAVIATSLGGLIACAVGVWILDGISVRFSMGAFGLVVDSAVVGAGLTAGVLLGFVGALPPALRALRMTIPESLKAV